MEPLFAAAVFAALSLLFFPMTMFGRGWFKPLTFYTMVLCLIATVVFALLAVFA